MPLPLYVLKSHEAHSGKQQVAHACWAKLGRTRADRPISRWSVERWSKTSYLTWTLGSPNGQYEANKFLIYQNICTWTYRKFVINQIPKLFKSLINVILKMRGNMPLPLHVLITFYALNMLISDSV